MLSLDRVRLAVFLFPVIKPNKANKAPYLMHRHDSVIDLLI